MGIITILIGLTLVTLSSIGVVASLRLRGFIANVLALAIIGYATIVLLAQILSELSLLSWGNLLVGHGLVLLLVFPFTLNISRSRLSRLPARFRYVRDKLQAAFAKNPDLIGLGLAISMAMAVGAYVILVVPPNATDALYYHLSRVAHWLQTNNLHHIQTPDQIKNVHPVNAEIGWLWLTALWGSDQLTGFLQWGATILTMLAIVGVGQRLQFSLPASLFAAFIWVTFPIVITQSTSTKNDILVAFFVMVMFYFLLAGLLDKEKAIWPQTLALSAVALGLAVGTKSLTFLIFPGLGLMTGSLFLISRFNVRSRLIYWAAGCLLSVLLLGSYNYVLNWLDYRAIFGPAEIGQDHTSIENISVTALKVNLARVGYQFFDLTGLPYPVIESIQQWRPLLGEKLFAWLNIPPDAPDTTWRGATFQFNEDRRFTPRDAISWYGPLGVLIFLPVLLYYLAVSPFTQKKVWRWFTAFLSFSYIVAFALLIRWQPAMGRYLMISVTIGAPLMAGLFFVSKPYIVLRWIVTAAAIWILGWSVIYNFHKPLAGPSPIWDMDYYELRLIIKPQLAEGYRYLDNTVPERTRLGIAGQGLALQWDYFLFGPRLKRNVTYLDLPANQVDANIFAEQNIDYLFLSEPGPIELKVPSWPLYIDPRTEWYLIKRDEAELFATKGDHLTAYERAFGDDYRAYLEIRNRLDQEPQPVQVLTTDPRMPFYDQDPRFVFRVTQDLEKLGEFTHLIIAPRWNREDFHRLGLSSSDLQSFLTDEKFVKKLFEINGYAVYQILL